MKLTDLFPRLQLDAAPHKGPHPSKTKVRSMVEKCRADDSDDCREIIAKGMLSAEQLHHAAERYRLGKSRSGKTIYWMIDERQRVLDGHIGDRWASQMLKAREPTLLSHWCVTHCLFGLHLLTTPTEEDGGAHRTPPVAIVETERSAVILSELFPEQVWMAGVTVANFTIDKLEPLRGRKVILCPSTDDTMTNYVAWLEMADMARRCYHLDISVSNVLEEHATPDQKRREIDLVDFLFE